MLLKNIFAGAVLVAAIGFVGCSDDTEHKATKKAQQSCQEALDIYQTSGDFEAARGELQNVRGMGRGAGAARDRAVFIGANLAFSEAERLEMGIDDERERVFAVTDEISQALSEAQKLMLEQVRLEVAAAARETAIAELNDVLFKVGTVNGSLEVQLEGLEAERQTFQRQVERAQEKVAQLQRQADSLLWQAEQVTGDEKINVQRQAYGLLLGEESGQRGRAVLVTEAQEGLDQIGDIDSEMALIRPRVGRLSDEIAALERRINDMKSSLNGAELVREASEIEKKLTQQQRNIGDLVRELGGSAQEYSDKITQIVDLLAQAGEEYEQVRSGSGTAVFKMATLGSADCAYRTGFICANNMKFQIYLGVRLMSLAELADEVTSDALIRVANECLQKAESFGFKAMESYVKAVEKYGELEGRLRRGDDEFASSVVKNQMLALIEQARLAQQLAEDSLAEDALAEAEGLVEKAVEYDGGFGNTLTAGLLREMIPDVVIPEAEEVRVEMAVAEPTEDLEEELEEAEEEPLTFEDVNIPGW